MNKIFDLRFVIGSFFTVVAVLLIIYSFISPESDAQIINRGCGILFGVFGIIMIILSFSKDAHDEIIE